MGDILPETAEAWNSRTGQGTAMRGKLMAEQSRLCRRYGQTDLLLCVRATAARAITLGEIQGEAPEKPDNGIRAAARRVRFLLF